MAAPSISTLIVPEKMFVFMICILFK